MATALNIPQLAQVPQCAYPAFGAIAAAGCGSDLACICSNDNFAVTLQKIVVEGCSPQEMQTSLLASRSICTEAVPWLAENHAPGVIAGVTVMSVVATVALVLRFLSRKISAQALWVDDWLVLAALVWSWGLTIEGYILAQHGWGRHMIMTDPHDLEIASQVVVASSLMFGVTTTLLKLSFLFFYYRIFPIRRFTITSIIIGVFVIIYFLSYELVQFLQCRPFAYNWDKTIPGGHCVNTKLTPYYCSFPLDIATNLAILILPIPYLWSLQMRTSRKIAISIIFLLGSFAIFGSIIRIPFYIRLKFTDFTYTIINVGIWLNVECHIGILSACLPVMKPLFKTPFIASLRSRFSKSRSQQRLPDADVERGAAADTSQRNLVNEIKDTEGRPKSWYIQEGYHISGKSSDGGEEESIAMGKMEVTGDSASGEQKRDSRNRDSYTI